MALSTLSFVPISCERQSTGQLHTLQKRAAQLSLEHNQVHLQHFDDGLVRTTARGIMLR